MAVELKQYFPNHSITVINRGVGGEEVGDMLKRFNYAVIAAKPDLVLWPATGWKEHWCAAPTGRRSVPSSG